MTAKTRLHGGSQVTVDAKVKRGPESWTYIYVVLGFALAIEGTIIQMTPAQFPWNLIAYTVIGGITFYLFIFSGKFQDKLIGMKNRYENKAR